jgi:digeranylgeranylglycerophospholipid reductase
VIDYDVVVVGAGPAGSMAAKTAAENGLDVLLLEKRPEIGTPVRCAEGVGKEHFEKLVKVDKKWVAADISGAKIYSPDGTEIILKEQFAGNEVGYVLERKIFDRHLVKLAANAGANVMVKTTAVGLKRSSKFRTAEVTIQKMDEIDSIETKIVIGADGVESRVGKWAGIDTTLALNEIESCAQYQLTNLDIDQNYCYFWLGNTSAPGGYIWYFPKGKNTANVGIGVLPSKAKRNPKYYLDNFISNKFPEGEIIEFVVGSEPVSPLESAVADNVMLVGDAARHVNPITGGGIVNALVGGLFAGIVATDSIEKGNYHAKALKKYDDLWKNDFGKKLVRYTKLQHKLIEMDDETLNTIFHSISDSKTKEASLKKLIIDLIKKNPKLLWDLKDVI